MHALYGIRTWLAAAAALAAAASALAASPTNPPLPERRAAAAPARAALPDGTVKAVIVKSWDPCGSGGSAWETINDHWQQFGTVPVFIDTSDSALCHGTITDAALEASGAQVVIISDPSGGEQKYSQDEADALMRYAQAGHDVIGTFLVFHYRTHENRVLAPLFGLDPDRTYILDPSVPMAFHARANSPLFDRVGQDYVSTGYPQSQVIRNKKWTKPAVGDDQIEAHDLGRQAAIVRYCGAGYRAVLFTWMPELGGTQDAQVLYNAIVQGREPGCKAE
jgi:hypothetical protein